MLVMPFGGVMVGVEGREVIRPKLAADTPVAPSDRQPESVTKPPPIAAIASRRVIGRLSDSDTFARALGQGEACLPTKPIA